MFADPYEITVDAVDYDLNRVGSGDSGARYRFSGDDVTFEMSISHAENKSRVRHLVKLQQAKTDADLYTPAVNTIYTMSAHLVVDVPIVGFTPSEQLEVVGALGRIITGSSYAGTIKLLNGES